MIGLNQEEVLRKTLGAIIGQEIQETYTAFAKLCRGRKKNNFSSTKVYECLSCK